MPWGTVIEKVSEDEFQLRDVNDGRLGLEDWVFRGMCDIVADEVGVHVAFEHGVRWGDGAEESTIVVSWGILCRGLGGWW